MGEASQSSARAPILALTGFMAAGKSTVARALSCRLRWKLVDLDCEIERRSNLPIHEIFTRHGEAHFRELEADTLRAAMAAVSSPTVIALGGGTFVQPQNAEQLRKCGAQVVYLELSLEQSLQRCRSAGDHAGQNPRPLAADETAFGKLYAQRLPSYRKAELIVSTHGKTPEQVADEIADSLGLVATPRDV